MSWHHNKGHGGTRASGCGGMGSAELSGVSDGGFGRGISPASLAIALSAFAGLLLFSLYDIHRTFAETRARVEMAARLAASEIAPRAVDAPRSTGFTMPDDLKDIAHYAIIAGDGEVLAGTFPAETMMAAPHEPRHHIIAAAPIAGELGDVLIGVPLVRVVPQLALRNGGILGAVLILAFVTIRRERPQRRVAGSSLEAAIDAVPYGLARWTARGRLVAANPAFRSLLRLEERHARRGASYGTVWEKITGRIESRPVLDDTCQRVVEIEREDGTFLLIDERPMPDGGFVTIVTDITDRRAADRMLAAIRDDQRQLARQYHEEKIRAEAASRAKTAFLAHLSHDIRTPLNHIIGFADLIGMETYGPLGDKRYGTYLSDIRQAGERLLGCFADILEFAELEGGRRVLKCEPIALCDLIEDAAARFSGRAARAGLHLDARLHATGYLAGDRQGLGRMLGNIIENAIRHTPRGGEIRLAAWAAEDGVVLEVSDTGLGMTEDQLSRLSQPFALSDAGCAKSHDGVGLGIAISRAIAEASGGRLVIDSLPEAGTTVAISLPMAEGLPVVGDTGARAA